MSESRYDSNNRRDMSACFEPPTTACVPRHISECIPEVLAELDREFYDPWILNLCYKQTPVALLMRTRSAECGTWYHFIYLPEFRALGLASLPGIPFPCDAAPSISRTLWPYFTERIPAISRPEIKQVIDTNGGSLEAFPLLVLLGRKSVTDPFELREVHQR